MREKVNSRFEFPKELDLWKYTEKGFDHIDPSIEKENESKHIGSRSNCLSSDTTNSNSDTINQKKNDSKSISSIETGDMVYKLKGIVIHSGDASAGHYY